MYRNSIQSLFYHWTFVPLAFSVSNTIFVAYAYLSKIIILLSGCPGVPILLLCWMHSDYFCVSLMPRRQSPHFLPQSHVQRYLPYFIWTQVGHLGKYWTTAKNLSLKTLTAQGCRYISLPCYMACYSSLSVRLL